MSGELRERQAQAVRIVQNSRHIPEQDSRFGKIWNCLNVVFDLLHENYFKTSSLLFE